MKARSVSKLTCGKQKSNNTKTNAHPSTQMLNATLAPRLGAMTISKHLVNL